MTVYFALAYCPVSTNTMDDSWLAEELFMN